MKSKQTRINTKLYELAKNKKLDLGVNRFDTNEREIIETTVYKNIDKITEIEIVEFREYLEETSKK